MPVVTKTATAKRDLIGHFVYLAENASVDVADRFLANAEASFNILSQQPSMGMPLTLRHPELAGMRKWRIMNSTTTLFSNSHVLTGYQLCACCIQRRADGNC